MYNHTNSLVLKYIIGNFLWAPVLLGSPTISHPLEQQLQFSPLSSNLQYLLHRFQSQLTMSSFPEKIKTGKNYSCHHHICQPVYLYLHGLYILSYFYDYSV